ncbi:hypothetical protein TVAG_165130 [Trichomonas vaginalis G3]|uniref:Uncharacterized protein n=1 Tax=Trichomonas vaginalis (strain ATCC PRA-98 / G3) TaxID=412133 RepID=A2DUJ4_TRIV3|nr:hypothetical protein TVAGG3_0663150 [Trichomonas vaginalis G3]EAY15885.1 hypothetical protein TVAG_165130 [Trichomonas vaginalis G3]KAI5506655.1 hypothetical protein TVAGG3_0663150 [Trichomonas vaginalis G3]|eukprot:XP_001328108.1 hypothetical protein [Trichomonas vaginalis G3]
MQNIKTINDFKTIEDIRKPREKTTAWSGENENMYNSLINLILNHKKEIQKVPLASSITTAQPWAEKRGMRAGVEDLDGDGTSEVVVYDKAGRSVIINGYKLRDSDFAMRQQYFTEHPSKESRIKEPSVLEWAKAKSYETRVDPNNPWITHSRLTADGQKLAERGYKMPQKPKKTQSVFSIFTKLISPYVKNYFEDLAKEDGVRLIIGEKGGPYNVEFIKKIVSPIVIYRMLYVLLIERTYFFHLKASGSPNLQYDAFKKFIKENPKQFWGFYKDNFLTKDLTKFKDKINVQIVSQAMVSPPIQMDGSDLEDSIVFLLGVKNCQDGYFMQLLGDNEEAGQFIEILKIKSHPENFEHRLRMNTYKEIARDSQRVWFKNLIEIFENSKEGLQRFVWANNVGLNPLSLAKSEQEVEKAGTSSPTKSGKPADLNKDLENKDKGEGEKPKEGEAPQSE